ncbi:hypothetical protein [Enterococcus sp. DIV0187]|uniref:hypothetical protein n=1 Tax=Enterococcus sp. DIV0187 TaxID=2774644 RepID=UPI003F26702B
MGLFDVLKILSKNKNAPDSEQILLYKDKIDELEKQLPNKNISKVLLTKCDLNFSVSITENELAIYVSVGNNSSSTSLDSFDSTINEFNDTELFNFIEQSIKGYEETSIKDLFCIDESFGGMGIHIDFDDAKEETLVVELFYFAKSKVDAHNFKYNEYDTELNEIELSKENQVLIGNILDKVEQNNYSITHPINKEIGEYYENYLKDKLN